MKEFLQKENILWDFDGVLIDSHKIRKEGFVDVLKGFPAGEVEKLLDYHVRNGGLSRYVKFRYFFEEIRGESVSNDKVQEFSLQFSKIMRRKLVDPAILIEESMKFVRENYKKYEMNIVSGSDEKELQFLCGKLGIDKYFHSILGSPTPKIEVVKKLIGECQYDLQKTVLVGDSINDFEAAKESYIDFYGYNNQSLIGKGAGYIENFSVKK